MRGHRTRLLVGLAAAALLGTSACSTLVRAGTKPEYSPAGPAVGYGYSPAPPTAAPVPAQPAPAPAAVAPSPDLLAAVNGDRARAGLKPLAENSCLAAVATQNAQRMAAADAAGPWNGSDRDSACGLADPQTAESGGYWSGGIDAAGANSLLLKNQADRQNVYYPYYEFAGYAWAVGPSGTAYFSMEFG